MFTGSKYSKKIQFGFEHSITAVYNDCPTAYLCYENLSHPVILFSILK